MTRTTATSLSSAFLLFAAFTLSACAEEERLQYPVGGGGSAETGGEEEEPGDDGEIGQGGGGCEEGGETLTFALTPPDVMLVLDKSRSMTFVWDHDADTMTPDTMRWTSLHGVVEQLVGSFWDRMRFGVKLFPALEADSQDLQGTACLVTDAPDVPVDENDAQTVLAGIPGAYDGTISGGTPATDGIEAARNHLLSIREDRPQYMVLVTDGAANCMDGVPWEKLGQHYDVNLPVTVGEAFTQDQIPTYVVGINIVDELIQNPDANPWQELNKVAQAGGMAREGDEAFYNVFDQIELQAALDEIAARIECTLTLDYPPPNPGLVSVELAGEEVPLVPSCTDSDGWTWTNGNGELAIELCGSACEELQVEKSVEVVFGCAE
jgi:hypothetical protein